jgi:hypothetical protein
LKLLKLTRPQSSSYYNLVPTPTSATIFSLAGLQQYVKLSPNKEIWARLPKKEASFTVEFHDLYAAVLFNVSQNFDHRTCTASWVHVALLDDAKQSKLGSEREPVVFLEDIREGIEKDVENVGNDSETRFYIRWKQQMISIQCSSIAPPSYTST